MSVLFIMPRWQDTSFGWMQRMLEGLTQDIVAVAVDDTQGNRYTKKGVRAISLRPPARRIRYISRSSESIGLSLRKAPKKAEDNLRQLIRKLPVTHLLCQYGTYAVKFLNVWRESELPLYIHFHGYDTNFDIRVADQPDKHVHKNGYLSQIKDLERRATFIVNSKFAKSRLTDAGISAESVAIKYYGVPVPDKKRIHNKRDKILILHLGNLVDCKSPDRTIRAFEIAKSLGLDGKLIVAGDGPLRVTCELLRIRSPYRDSIQILGAVGSREAQDLFSQADIFTAHNVTGEITRQTESFGVSIVEAMAHGLPVVGTRSGGVNETMVDGVTGFLNAPGDVEAQATAFLRLARNPDLRQQMGDAGRTRVAARYNPQQEVDQLRKIMNIRT